MDRLFRRLERGKEDGTLAINSGGTEDCERERETRTKNAPPSRPKTRHGREQANTPACRWRRRRPAQPDRDVRRATRLPAVQSPEVLHLAGSALGRWSAARPRLRCSTSRWETEILPRPPSLVHKLGSPAGHTSVVPGCQQADQLMLCRPGSLCRLDELHVCLD